MNDAKKLTNNAGVPIADNQNVMTAAPEALHQITIVMSDRGIPATYRHMRGLGVTRSVRSQSASNTSSTPSALAITTTPPGLTVNPRARSCSRS
jgi:hypothetical protein